MSGITGVHRRRRGRRLHHGSRRHRHRRSCHVRRQRIRRGLRLLLRLDLLRSRGPLRQHSRRDIRLLRRHDSHLHRHRGTRRIRLYTLRIRHASPCPIRTRDRRR
jgi:hypothetical protein